MCKNEMTCYLTMFIPEIRLIANEITHFWSYRNPIGQECLGLEEDYIC